MLLAEEEQSASAALIAKVQSAEPLALKSIAKEIEAWMTAHTKHRRYPGRYARRVHPHAALEYIRQ